MAVSGAAEARELILKHGWNATAYQILNPGFTLWFSSAGDAVIGYVTRSRTRVVGGAPICSNDRLRSAVEEFVADAYASAESICFFGAGARLESALIGEGSWSAASLGAQPSWNPQRWDEIIQTRSSVRAQLNRAANKGVTVSLRESITDEEMEELRRVLAQWLSTRGLPPLHFLVEPETLPMLDDRLLIVAERNAQPLGFVVVSPVAARNGWLVEQIVRGRGAPNGTAELMIDAAMREISRRGATYATLGLCPLSSHSQFEQNRMPPWLRLALRLTRAHGKRFYNFAGLDAFKNKFAPEEWEEIVALADAKAFPPKTLWAIAAAFSNGSPLVLIAKATWRALVLELSWLLDRFRTSTT